MSGISVCFFLPAHVFFPDAAAILGRAVRGLHPPDVRYPEVGRHPWSRRQASFPPEAQGEEGGIGLVPIYCRFRSGAQVLLESGTGVFATSITLLPQHGFRNRSEWNRHRHQQGPGKEQTVVSAQLYCGVSL